MLEELNEMMCGFSLDNSLVTAAAIVLLGW